MITAYVFFDRDKVAVDKIEGGDKSSFRVNSL